MRVRQRDSVDATILEKTNQWFPEQQRSLSHDVEYEVYAIAVSNGPVLYQIVDDIEMINWYPSDLSEVTDGSMPPDWICSSPGQRLKLIIGPEYVSTNEETYEAMVGLELDSTTAFWKRFYKQRGE